jgi:hypothetical protein
MSGAAGSEIRAVGHTLFPSRKGPFRRQSNRSTLQSCFPLITPTVFWSSRKAMLRPITWWISKKPAVTLAHGLSLGKIVRPGCLFAQSPLDDRFAIGRGRVVGGRRRHFRNDKAFSA